MVVYSSPAPCKTIFDESVIRECTVNVPEGTTTVPPVEPKAVIASWIPAVDVDAHQAPVYASAVVIVTVPGIAAGHEASSIGADSAERFSPEIYTKPPTPRPGGQEVNLSILSDPKEERSPETPEPLVKDQT
jgi:hypothetical protein